MTSVILMIVPVVWIAAFSEEPPVTFCRSGQEVNAKTISGPRDNIHLMAFGRTWSRVKRARNGVARVMIPSVRVPTVFQLISTRSNRKVLGEIVAYPKDGLFNSSGTAVFLMDPTAPPWLSQWMTAIGIPFRTQKAASHKLQARTSDSTRHCLLVGRRNSLMPAPPSRKDPSFSSVIVFVSSSPAALTGGEVTLKSSHLRAGLSSLNNQKWSQSLRFTGRYPPCAEIVNRRSWIQTDSTVFVEEVFRLPEQRIVMSYLPWERQLGRNEIADVVFFNLLRAAANSEKAGMFKIKSVRIFPEGLRLDGNRPVIATLVASTRVAPESGTSTILPELQILDLRGKTLEKNLAASVESAIRRWKSTGGDLLVLGTDPRIAHGRWSRKKNGMKKTDGDRFYWLPDDNLPTSLDQKITLMRTLTELGVKLKPSLEK